MESHTITFEPQLTDAEFYELCRRLDPMNVEMTKEGTVRMMTPAGNESSEANAEIITQLRNWWKTHRVGRVFDSNTLFKLPDGSQRGPDAAYISDDRVAAIPREAFRNFAPVCPNFVIELLSASDSLEEALDKMRTWISNGAELGWLIDPYKRHSYIFNAIPGGSNTSSASELYGSGPVEGFVLDLTEVWRAYD